MKSKVKKTEIDKSELIEAFAEFKDSKNIDKATVVRVQEDVFRAMLKKEYGSDENFDIIVNPDNGELEIWQNYTVVADEDIYSTATEMEYSDAVKHVDDCEIGDDIAVKVDLSQFKRRAIYNARQTLNSRSLELKNADLFRKYKEMVGEVIVGEVYQIWKKEMMILHEGNELSLPRANMIGADFFKKGDSIRAVIEKVEMNNAVPKISLSRTAPIFLERLLEREVPEIMDGVIAIKKIVRLPGERAKVAVESYDDRVDPVGACVGMKGSRIHSIVRELRNENIDVVNFTTNTILYISRALNPAKITSVKLDEETKRASVFLKPDQVAMAIGKGGQNIKLAGELTGYTVDVFRDGEEINEEDDVDLEEFADEIDSWIIDELKKTGCDTARSVLALSDDELVRRTELEEETIREIKQILLAEFEG
ncbi:MAG: transcription termination factor NusA [Bacteroidetes bacterium]|nr:transcription termination factor NusA [Bacteroidota bacterium]